MKDNLREDITQFLAQFRLVSAFYRFDELVRFLDQIRNQGLVGLFSVPCAAFGGTEDLEEQDQALYGSERRIIDFVTKFRHSKLTFRQELADHNPRRPTRGVCLTRGAAVGIMAG